MTDAIEPEQDWSIERLVQLDDVRRWTKHGFDRLYVNVLRERTNLRLPRRDLELWFDLEDRCWRAKYMERDHAEALVESVERALSSIEPSTESLVDTADEPHPDLPFEASIDINGRHHGGGWMIVDQEWTQTRDDRLYRRFHMSEATRKNRGISTGSLVQVVLTYKGNFPMDIWVTKIDRAVPNKSSRIIGVVDWTPTIEQLVGLLPMDLDIDDQARERARDEVADRLIRLIQRMSSDERDYLKSQMVQRAEEDYLRMPVEAKVVSSDLPGG